MFLLLASGSAQSTALNVPANKVVAKQITNQPLGKLGMIIILDALNVTVLEQADTPNIDYLASQGLAFFNATTVLPSATTSAHVSLVTGAPPEIHGVVHTVAYNASRYHELLIDESPDLARLYYEDMLRVKTLLEVVKEGGVKVGLIVSKSKLEVMMGRTRAADKFLVLPDEVIGSGDPHEATYPFEKRKECMEWITNSTIKTIEEFYQYILNGESALIIAHYAEPDWIQGAVGVMHPDTIALVEFLDSQVGRIINKLNELNLWSRTFLVLAADHGFTDVDPTKNLLSSDVTHLSAIHTEHVVMETAGLLLYIYLKYPSEIQEVVNELQKYPWVKNIWTRYPTENSSGTLSDIGLNVEFAGDIVLDIKPPYYASKYYGLGAHGGTSTQTIPIIFAGGLLKKKHIETPSIIDIAPTMALLYGVALPNATGKAFDIVAPSAEVRIKVTPGIAEPGETVTAQVNYSISEELSGLSVELYVFFSNGTEYYHDNTSIVGINGSLTFSIELLYEDTYTFYCLVVDSEGNILGGKTVSVLVVAVEKPSFPVEKVAIGLAITVIFSSILIALPIVLERRKKIET